MTRYLLAAEADQIQDLLFRSSRLREVVGGSQLLSQFCREGAEQLLEHKQHGGKKKQLIVNDGGAFRVWFTDRDKAREFGRDLAELYRRCTGGSLTVADELPEYEEGDNASFIRASNEAHAALRAAKNRGQQARTTAAHLPYAAFCAACGVAVANEHCLRPGTDEDERKSNYICRHCLHKAAAARRSEEQEAMAEGFLDVFRSAVWAQLEPGTRLDFPKRGDWPEALAKLEPRRYVAYLKADGNGMGALFKSCRTEDDLCKLSVALPRVLREALAAPCRLLRDRIGELEISKKDKDVLPVLPLILGGDDLFALLPARWALHFAAEFCRVYEEKILTALRDEVKLPEAEASDSQSQPTIAAAVVICKANYPYTLAHQRCEQLLKEAKQLSRRMELTEKRAASTVNFTVITGNDVGGLADSEQGEYRATLRPYFVNESAADKAEKQGEAGLAITRLIEQRRALCALPGKRCAELEALYDVSKLRGMRDDDRADWARARQAIISRLTKKEAVSVEGVFSALGKDSQQDTIAASYWRSVHRPPQENFNGHGLPDLLAAWDFAWALNKPRAEYQVNDQGEE